MKQLLFYLFLILPMLVFAQFGNQQIIGTGSNLPTRALAGDINGDGNLDIVISARTSNHISWYENLGNGNFGPLNFIGNLSESYWVDLADFDNDGDIDIVASSANNNLVVWYENLDGLGNFGGQNLISSTADGANGVIGADLDGDGDMDIVSASSFSGIQWYKNLNGQGNFGSPILITNTTGITRSVYAADMDNDGDLDILANGTFPPPVYWLENMDGLGNFGTLHIISDMGVYRDVVIATDMDGDGDNDVVTASPADDEVAWCENIDGLGNFGSKNVINSTLDNTSAVYAADLDNDGDMDVLTCSSLNLSSGEIVWFENLNGLGNFGNKNVITTEVQSPRRLVTKFVQSSKLKD